MFFRVWALRIFMVTAFFLPRDLIDLAGWFVLLMTALEIASPVIETFYDWDDE